uniref:Uncharacterized protein n=1 Tax=Utricularia reniformis TaxID=192314 RepID=A0A1Y0B0I1_9LAMI|nr:hypothetical protein AEK19_MT0706 [Utricularia reniformis]ART30952.1 hypothetical protein AEK19_MT0706 [Utricularia reniformis]
MRGNSHNLFSYPAPFTLELGVQMSVPLVLGSKLAPYPLPLNGLWLLIS